MIGHFNSFQVLNETINKFHAKSICQGVIAGTTCASTVKNVVRSKKCLRLCSTNKSCCTHCTYKAYYIRKLLKNKSYQKLTGKIKNKARLQAIERRNRRMMQHNKELLNVVKTIEQEKEELIVRARKDSLLTHLKTLPAQLLPNV
ncbi:hypothetical protein GHT06_010664 [Daphnia sinensis]|uniref:Uncharacterized protein n=1 Tax=Daphnia sinensis TaxID=1820382 RepID=A0AAD5PX63_9CRUS|nr:hypothetical protein GHT06_010664 [Daphnia sinensis]